MWGHFRKFSWKNIFKNDKVAEERKRKKAAKKAKQKIKKDNDAKEHTEEISIDSEAEVSETIDSIPVNNTFAPLEKHEEGAFETDKDDTDEVVEPKRDTDSNLPMTEPKVPDTSKHHDNMSDMNAAEFEHFLNEIVSNYISKSK